MNLTDWQPRPVKFIILFTDISKYLICGLIYPVLVACGSMGRMWWGNDKAHSKDCGEETFQLGRVKLGRGVWREQSKHIDGVLNYYYLRWCRTEFNLTCFMATEMNNDTPIRYGVQRLSKGNPIVVWQAFIKRRQEGLKKLWK